MSPTPDPAADPTPSRSTTHPPQPGAPEPLGPGEAVLLIDRKQRRYLVRLTPGGSFHYHGGSVAHDDLIGAVEGSRVRSAQGTALLAVRPTAADWTLKARRGAQVVYPKDQAMILSLADIAPGATVVEAGAGSGALTSALLRAVGPNGRVVSFEMRDDHADVAAQNVADRFGGLPENWELRRVEVTEGLAGVSCDRLVLDLLEPDRVIPAAVESVHPGGIVCAYTPTVPQVMRLRDALRGGAWGLAETSETLLRPWQVDGLSVRPDHRMVAHTAFITTARRLAPSSEVGPRGGGDLADRSL